MRGRCGWAGVALAVLLGACGAGAEPPLTGPPVEDPGPPTTFVAVGDTETESGGLDFPRSLREGWPYVLHTTALPPNTAFVNLAERSTTVDEALVEQVPTALSLQPDLVTVWLVREDVEEGTPVARYRQDLETLVGRLRQDGRARVLLAWRFPVPDASGGTAPYDDAIEAVAGSTGAELVDLSGVDARMGRDGHAQAADAFRRVVGGRS